MDLSLHFQRLNQGSKTVVIKCPSCPFTVHAICEEERRISRPTLLAGKTLECFVSWIYVREDLLVGQLNADGRVHIVLVRILFSDGVVRVGGD